MALSCNSLLFSNSFAEESLLDNASQEDYKIELSPASKRTSFKPGEQKKDSFQLKNVGAKAVSVDIYAVAYYTEDDSATQSEELSDAYTQMSQWITFEDSNGEYYHKASFVLYPNQIREVRYAVDVPADAVGGGQYAILFAEFAPAKVKSEDATLYVHSRIGMAFFAYVDDEGIVRNAEINDIKALSGLALNRKIDVGYTVKNTGNIDFQTSTEITVRSIFGKELYHDILVETIFPEKSKEIYAQWDKTPSFGIFHLDYTINALDSVDEGSNLIIVISSGTLVFLLFVLVVAIILIKYLRLKKARERRTKILKENYS